MGLFTLEFVYYKIVLDSEELGNYDIRRTLSNDDNSIVNDENSVINWNLEKFENFGCRAYVPWLYFQPDIYSTKYYNGESLNSSCASMVSLYYRINYKYMKHIA